MCDHTSRRIDVATSLSGRIDRHKQIIVDVDVSIEVEMLEGRAGFQDPLGSQQ